MSELPNPTARAFLSESAVDRDQKRLALETSCEATIERGRAVEDVVSARSSFSPSL